MATVLANPAANTSNTSSYVAYADLSQLLVQGRLLHAELVQNNGGQFVSVTVVTTTVKGDETGTAIVFNSSDLVDKLNAGWLVPGRRLTVSGKLGTIRTHYLKQGELVQLKRPELKCFDMRVVEFGALPKSARA